MFKKLTLLAMAVVALVVFAVPAAAQAEPIVTDSLGEEATHITAVSENTVSTTPVGKLECDTVDLTLTGSTGKYHGSGTAKGGATEPHAGPCASSAGFHVHITSITAAVDLPAKTASFTYAYQLTTPMGTLSCTFTASEAAVSYTSGSDKISVSGSMTGSGPGCATSGSISGEFTVTSGGEPVVIH